VGIFAKDDVDSFSDAIVALYKRRAEFDTIKQKAKKIAQKHSWSSITMNQLIPKYKNLMEQ